MTRETLHYEAREITDCVKCGGRHINLRAVPLKKPWVLDGIVYDSVGRCPKTGLPLGFEPGTRKLHVRWAAA